MQLCKPTAETGVGNLNLSEMLRDGQVEKKDPFMPIGDPTRIRLRCIFSDYMVSLDCRVPQGAKGGQFRYTPLGQL